MIWCRLQPEGVNINAEAVVMNSLYNPTLILITSSSTILNLPINSFCHLDIALVLT